MRDRLPLADVAGKTYTTSHLIVSRRFTLRHMRGMNNAPPQPHSKGFCGA
jgi:hypothetical protein